MTLSQFFYRPFERFIKILFYFMFPNPDYLPFFLSVMLCDLTIPFHISFDLFLPKSRSGFRHSSVFCASVPKTRIDKNHRLIFFQHDVRSPEIFPYVFSVPESRAPKSLPEFYFYAGFRRSHSRHYFRSLLFGKYICHVRILIFRIIKFSLCLLYFHIPSSTLSSQHRSIAQYEPERL